MQKKVTLVLIATGLMLSSCVPLTVNSATISKVVSNVTIQDSNSVTYYRNDGVYFKLSMQSDSSSDYDNIGKWRVIGNDNFNQGKLCTKDIRANTICKFMTKDSGKWYFNGVLEKPIKIEEGHQLLDDRLAYKKHNNLKAIKAYEKMFGQSQTTIALKKKVLHELHEEQKRAEIQKQQEKIEKEKRERARKVRESRRAQQKASRSTSSYSGSGRYISKLGYCTTKLTHDSFWSRGCITLNDGSTIWANLLRKSGGCWSLLVGSSETNIYGNCSNCSNDINGYWSCNASGYGSFSYQGDPANAVNAIVQRSN